ncbi:hypothetical protein C0991_009972 [Blastosporella zonata]|nr:hypothetical protein C0991_009972 [Blastosporella zonata]
MPFSSAGMQVLACLIHLLGAIIVFGVGLETNSVLCQAGIFLCIAFYATSKLLIYAFLGEKVHIVWSPTAGRPRFKSPVYIVCFVTVSLYVAIIVLLLIGRNHFFRADDACVIGLKPYASIPLLTYDLYVAFFTTSHPVFTVQVVVNALAIFWVTQHGDSRSIYSDSERPSKALQDRERRHTGTFTPDAKNAAKARFSMSQPRSFDGPMPNNSGEQMLRELRDIESGRKRTSTYKALKSITDSLFSTNRDHQAATRSRGLHITVTTEYELEESNIGLDSIPELSDKTASPKQ